MPGGVLAPCGDPVIRLSRGDRGRIGLGEGVGGSRAERRGCGRELVGGPAGFSACRRQAIGIVPGPAQLGLELGDTLARPADVFALRCVAGLAVGHSRPEVGNEGVERLGQLFRSRGGVLGGGDGGQCPQQDGMVRVDGRHACRPRRGRRGGLGSGVFGDHLLSGSRGSRGGAGRAAGVAGCVLGRLGFRRQRLGLVSGLGRAGSGDLRVGKGRGRGKSPVLGGTQRRLGGGDVDVSLAETERSLGLPAAELLGDTGLLGRHLGGGTD